MPLNKETKLIIELVSYKQWTSLYKCGKLKRIPGETRYLNGR